MEIKASDVKALREKTGAGMKECKKSPAGMQWRCKRSGKILKRKRPCGC